MKKTPKYPAMPQPVKREQRICFGIMWFSTPEDAETAAKNVEFRGLRYNGGYFDGKPCGREERFDTKAPDGSRLYAVTC